MNAKKIIIKKMEYVYFALRYTNMGNVLFVILVKIIKFLIIHNVIAKKNEFEMK